MTGDLVKAMRACPQPIVARGRRRLRRRRRDDRAGVATCASARRSKTAFLFMRVGLAGCRHGRLRAAAAHDRPGPRGGAAVHRPRDDGATKAHAWGFFNALHDRDALLARRAGAGARSWPTVRRSRTAMTKKLLHQEWAMELDEAIEAEAQAQAICMQTQDFRRAYEAFVAKQQAGVRRRLSHAPTRPISIHDAPRDWPFFDDAPSRAGARARAVGRGADSVDERDDRRRLPRWCARSATPAGCATACRPRTAARCERARLARAVRAARDAGVPRRRWPISRSRCRASAAARSRWPAARRSARAGCRGRARRGDRRVRLVRAGRRIRRRAR